MREAALAATAHVPGHARNLAGLGGQRRAAARTLGDYLRDLKALFQQATATRRRSTDILATGSSIAASSSICARKRAWRHWRRFLDEAADLVVRYGGSLSGEHGDGQARGALLEKMYGPELIQAFREFKAIWDPDGRMNPGKVVDPFPITANLRVGPLYQPPEVAALFRLSRRWRQLRQGHAALRRRRHVPPRRTARRA